MRRSVVGAVLLLFGLVLAAPGESMAADPVAPSEDRAVPWVPQDANHGTRLALFGSQFVGVTREVYRPTADPQLDMRSTVDGSVAARIPDPDNYGDVILSGRTLLRTGTGHRFEPNLVTATDVITGEALWTITVGPGEYVASVGESWVLTSVDGRGILRRPGEPERTVEGLHLSDPSSAGPTIVGDSGGLLVTNGVSSVYAVDLSSATARVLATDADRVHVAAGPTRWFAATSDYSTDSHTIAWWDRVGPGSGSVTLPGVDDYYARYFAYGDELVHVGDHGWSYSLQPVDLQTGETGSPLLADAAEVRSLGDGRILAHLTDTPNGRVVILEAGQAMRTLVDLPEIGRPAGSVALDGGRVFTGYGSPTEGATWSVPSTGDGAATLLADEAGAVRGQLVDVEGGTVLTRAGEGVNSRWLVSWPGGQRELAGRYLEVTLGAGGLVLRKDDGTTSTYEDARSGAALGSAPRDVYSAVDGTTEWTGPDTAGRLTARDLVTGASRFLETGATGCSTGYLMAKGRWVLVSCGERWQAMDTSGVLRPRGLTAGWVWPSLGDGYVAWLERSGEGSVLVTQDLGTGFTTRRYGPAAFDHTPAPATHGSLLAYLDDAHLARVADLDWLTSAPTSITDDTVGPEITEVGGSPPQTNQPLVAEWSARDTTGSTTQFASGLASYDVRYQQPVHQQPPTSGGWLTAPWGTNLTTTRVDLPATTGRDTCWSVRAKDKSANTGPWSATECVYHDTVAPDLAALSVGPRVIASAATRTVTFSFQVGINNQDWATTDVAYRLATSGSGYGSWVQPAAWTNVQTAYRRLSVAAGQDACFRARARDAAGNIGRWFGPVCTSVPFDDRALTRSGSATRTTSSLAVSGTTTNLNATGAKVYRTGQTGTKVAVIALRGPGQGVVDVFVGTRKVGRLYLAATKWSRTTTTFATGSFTHATVTLRSVSSKPSRIDALAILRS